MMEAAIIPGSTCSFSVRFHSKLLQEVLLTVLYESCKQCYVNISAVLEISRMTKYNMIKK